jgi:hypothetical protein
MDGLSFLAPRTGPRTGWPVHSPGTSRPAPPPTASAPKPSLPARASSRFTTRTPFDHFIARPPVQAGPPRPALTRMARTLHPRPLRSGRAHAPGPDSDGPDSQQPSPSTHPARRHGKHAALTPPGSALRCALPYPCTSNRGRASCSTQQVQVRSTGVPYRRDGLRVESGPFRRERQAPLRPTGTSWHPSPSSYPRAPDSADSAQVGRVHPNHLAALQSGMQMGFKSPEQHVAIREQVKRVQVLETSLV